jgi:ELWxxDGT repeat protein
LTYFKATDATGGTELWQTNGIDAAGTTIVGDILPGTGSSSPANLVGVNNTLFFVANGVPVGGVSPSGTEVWKVGDLGTNTIPTATFMDQDYTATPLSEGSVASTCRTL